MSDLDDFLAATHPRLIAELHALHNGDPNPQLEAWSTQDPVTVFGAKVPLRSGWDEISGTFRWLATRWSDCTDQRLDLVAAGVSGDLAYMVGFEHIAHSVEGVPVEPYTLRVTHIYRREQGEWKIAHRHADHVPVDQTLPAKHRQGSAKRSMELPKLMLAALGPRTIGNHWYLADSSGHDRAGISPADGPHSGMDCRSLRASGAP